MPKPTPELRRARLAASAIKGLTVKPGAQGKLLWYWEPNRAEKAAGWKPLAFGADKRAAQSGAETRNAEVAAWRRGEDPVPARSSTGSEGAGHSSDANTPKLAPPPAKHRAFETIGEHAARYRTQYLVHMSAGHQRTAGSNLKLICDVFGDLLPSDIQPHHITNWTDSLRGRGDFTAKGRQVSDTTAHNRLRTFRALLAWIKNPHEKFGQPKGRNQIWEADDRAAFIAAANDLGYPNMALAMRLAFYTGQRTQSLLAFTEAQLTEMKHILDPQDRAFFAEPDAKGIGRVWGWEFIQAKSERADSPVHMHIPFEPDLLADVRAAIARNRAIDRAPKADGASPRLLTHVLVNETPGKPGGEPWLYRHFNRRWNEIKDHAIKCTGRVGMDQLVWHDFRRSRVVELKRQGFSHDRIATLTGHQPDSVNAIMKIYGPVDSNMTVSLLAASAEQARQRKKA
ncbi:hypothetical protein [Novosphingobium sp. FKTRR1]|uniref:hypothetical protein n=1 Tax=Novosphingobium sp. FKTRR1 TaxID=2879118 RepID=UPI001CF05BB0|nr:hypothetical protein [Novosphingobium sp. FKTRR1]